MSNKVFRNLLVGAGLAVVALGSTAAMSNTAQIKSDIDAATIVPAKATPLELYLTPEEADRALTADPGIIFIDVRDPLEVMFVGHPEGVDKNIPLGIATHEVDPNTGQYRLVANDDFVADVDALVAKQGKTKMGPIIVSCRSGARSAIAARKLIDAGYTNVWSLVEGFEGDKAPDGTRTKKRLAQRWPSLELKARPRGRLAGLRQFGHTHVLDGFAPTGLLQVESHSSTICVSQGASCHRRACQLTACCC